MFVINYNSVPKLTLCRLVFFAQAVWKNQWLLGFNPDDARGRAPGGFDVGNVLAIVHGE